MQLTSSPYFVSYGPDGAVLRFGNLMLTKGWMELAEQGDIQLVLRGGRARSGYAYIALLRGAVQAPAEGRQRRGHRR